MEKAIINALIALCQREGILPTNLGELADEIQRLAADEMYISRMYIEDLIKANHYKLTAKDNSTDYGMFTTGIRQAINETPTADVVEVRHGQWSWYTVFTDYIVIKYVCSQCNCTNKYATAFCPHCGAQMDEEVVKE